MDVGQRLQDLANDPANIAFRRVELLDKLFPFRELSEDENMKLICKCSVCFDDIGMVHSLAGLNFGQNLFMHFIFVDGGLENLFQRVHRPCFSMPTLEHFTKFPLPNVLPHFKHLHADAMCFYFRNSKYFLMHFVKLLLLFLDLLNQPFTFPLRISRRRNLNLFQTPNRADGIGLYFILHFLRQAIYFFE